MGSDVTITCLTSGGYPHYQDISLFLSSEVVTVQSGIPYHLHNVTSQDAGLIKCALTDVTSQPSAYSIVNVYSKSLQDNKPHSSGNKPQECTSYLSVLLYTLLYHNMIINHEAQEISLRNVYTSRDADLITLITKNANPILQYMCIMNLLFSL